MKRDLIRWTVAVILLVLGFLAAYGLVSVASPAPRWRATIASYEGLVGYRDACGGRVDTQTLGLASHYPCGTVIWVRYGKHVVRAVTKDHGPYGDPRRALDIWDATARGLGFRSGHAFGLRHVSMAVGR
jgi:hypothetical protein